MTASEPGLNPLNADDFLGTASTQENTTTAEPEPELW